MHSLDVSRRTVAVRLVKPASLESLHLYSYESCYHLLRVSVEAVLSDCRYINYSSSSNNNQMSPFQLHRHKVHYVRQFDGIVPLELLSLLPNKVIF